MEAQESILQLAKPFKLLHSHLSQHSSGITPMAKMQVCLKGAYGHRCCLISLLGVA